MICLCVWALLLGAAEVGATSPATPPATPPERTLSGKKGAQEVKAAKVAVRLYRDERYSAAARAYEALWRDYERSEYLVWAATIRDMVGDYAEAHAHLLLGLTPPEEGAPAILRGKEAAAARAQIEDLCAVAAKVDVEARGSALMALSLQQEGEPAVEVAPAALRGTANSPLRLCVQPGLWRWTAQVVDGAGVQQEESFEVVVAAGAVLRLSVGATTPAAAEVTDGGAEEITKPTVDRDVSTVEGLESEVPAPAPEVGGARKQDGLRGLRWGLGISALVLAGAGAGVLGGALSNYYVEDGLYSDYGTWDGNKRTLRSAIVTNVLVQELGSGLIGGAVGLAGSALTTSVSRGRRWGAVEMVTGGVLLAGGVAWELMLWKKERQGWCVYATNKDESNVQGCDHSLKTTDDHKYLDNVQPQLLVASAAIGVGAGLVLGGLVKLVVHRRQEPRLEVAGGRGMALRLRF
ncbi:MAG: hypothetical protein IPK80_04055 [Nannocystis sp.]|nr:hypothetical protein [Nannocystis sp.]